MPATFWRICSASAVVIGHQRRRDRPCGRRACRTPARPAPATMSVSLATTCACIAFVRLLLVELAQPVGELDRERHAAHGAHLVVAPASRPQRRKPCIRRLQIELVAGEVHLDQRLLAGPPRAQRHPAAPHRLPQRRREIGDPRPERAPRGLALHVDVHVGCAAQPGTPDE